MSDKEARVPLIRFAGFVGDWEERKLGEVIEDYVEKTTIQNQHPVLTSSQQQGIVLQEVYFADRQVTTNDNIGYFVLPRGFFTYRSRSDTNVFVFNRNNLIDKGIISYYYPVFRPKNSDSNFLLRRLNYGVKHQLSMAAEGTGQKVLGHSKFKKMVFRIPSFNEQVRIGFIFEQLDNLLTLQQRKVDKLVIVKKTMLEKMFPKDGSNAPEIRFAGFTGAWEERKLKEIAVRITRKNKDLEATRPLTISARDGLIDQNDFFNKTVASRDVSGYYLVRNGEFAYNKSYSKGYPWGAVKRLEKYDMGVLSTLYIVFKPIDVDSDFLAKYYDTNSWHIEVSKHAAEGARNHGLLNIAASNFFETKLIIPSTKTEQNKIAQLIITIDRTITLHQRELNTLKTLKKSMLQQLFV